MLRMQNKIRVRKKRLLLAGDEVTSHRHPVTVKC